MYCRGTVKCDVLKVSRPVVLCLEDHVLITADGYGNFHSVGDDDVVGAGAIRFLGSCLSAVPM